MWEALSDSHQLLGSGLNVFSSVLRLALNRTSCPRRTRGKYVFFLFFLFLVRRNSVRKEKPPKERLLKCMPASAEKKNGKRRLTLYVRKGWKRRVALFLDGTFYGHTFTNQTDILYLNIFWESLKRPVVKLLINMKRGRFFSDGLWLIKFVVSFLIYGLNMLKSRLGNLWGYADPCLINTDPVDSTCGTGWMFILTTKLYLEGNLSCLFSLLSLYFIYITRIIVLFCV